MPSKIMEHTGKKDMIDRDIYQFTRGHTVGRAGTDAEERPCYSCLQEVVLLLGRPDQWSFVEWD
jgi:hypothetical protein